MKKFLALVLAAVMVLALGACGEPKPAPIDPNAIEITMEVEQIPEDAMEKGIITAVYNGETLWTVETEPVYVGMYETVIGIGGGADGYIYISDGTVYCLNPVDGSLLWSNEDYNGQGTSCCIDDSGNIYLAACYGPVLMVIDKDGKTVARHDEIYYEFSDGEKAPVSEYYMPYDLDVTEDGYASVALDSTDTYVVIDPETGVVVDEYIYTEPVDPEFLVGSWAFYEGNSFHVDIEEDMSFVMFIAGEDGTTQHIYCGNVELSVFDEKHSSGMDYIRFVLDHEKSKAYAGGDFADPYFDDYESAGDYIVRWCETFENYSDAMVLVQVNNGDSVCGWYLDTNALDLTKVESVG